MNQKWMPLLIIGPFLKGCVFPTWSSALELGLVCGLVVLLSQLRPKSVGEERKIEELSDKLQNLHSQLQTLKIKIGFKPND